METSFSAAVKEQISRIPLTNMADALAEAYGMLLFAAAFDAQEIRFVTEQPALLYRLPLLFAKAFSLTFECGKTQSGVKTVFRLTDQQAIRRVFEAFGLNPDKNMSGTINRAVLEEESTHTAFLRGAFLTGGSVADPSVRYHLELVTHRYNLCQELIPFLREMDLEPKCTLRRSCHVLYYKDSELIANFLTSLGSSMYALKVMTVKVEKDVRNQINRAVNCEAANIAKTVDAAYSELQAIEKLRESSLWENLPPKLKSTAVLREENPDLSLAQLAGMVDPPMSRATLNYRLKKLIALAKCPAEIHEGE